MFDLNTKKLNAGVLNLLLTGIALEIPAKVCHFVSSAGSLNLWSQFDITVWAHGY